MSAHTKILIADDDACSREIVRVILERAGYEVLVASNGLEAIELYKREDPDLVILDVSMPGMNGFEVARNITQVLATNFVPIIFLTASSDDETMLKCIDSGGDEVLVKPLNQVLLLAKIRAMRRILSLYLSLEDYRSRTEEELQLARHVFATITQRMKEFIPGLGHWTQAAGHLPGDIILYDTTPSGQVYAMLADFTGHGLSAAVGAIPVADIFFALTRKDFSLADIIVEINRKLRHIFPVGHFCAAAFVSSDPGAGSVKVWNGGLPEAVLVSQDREVIARFPSRNLALGIVNFDVTDVVLQDAPNVLGSKLVLYSDGLTEATNAVGEEFGAEGLERAIANSEGWPLFDSLKMQVMEYAKGVKFEDDVSLLVLPIQFTNNLDIWT
jgi:CheY-like chemotaxis protein